MKIRGRFILLSCPSKFHCFSLVYFFNFDEIHLNSLITFEEEGARKTKISDSDTSHITGSVRTSKLKKFYPPSNLKNSDLMCALRANDVILILMFTGTHSKF